MKTAEELRTDLIISPALRRLTGGKTPFFFDIETTGLSSLAGYIYLIGCLEETPDGWLFRQWFAENADEEVLVLRAFSDALRPARTLGRTELFRQCVDILRERFPDSLSARATVFLRSAALLAAVTISRAAASDSGRTVSR